MTISLNDWIRLGSIQPLQWGNSLHAFFTLWPTEKTAFEELLQNGYPFLALDNVEFYFEGNEFKHLSEVVIKAWCLDEKEKSAFFDYDWLRAGLTFPEVRAALSRLAIPHAVERGPSFNTPNIRTASGSLFAFYIDPGQKDEEALLSKVYLAESVS